MFQGRQPVPKESEETFPKDKINLSSVFFFFLTFIF